MLTTKNFSDIVAFSRASSAWRVSSGGVWVQDGANVPRLDCDPVTLASRGMLFEEPRTNVLLYSQDPSNAAWIKFNSIATPGAAMGIDGAMSAVGLTETAANSGHAFGQSATKAAAVERWTATFIVKAAARRYVRVLIGNSTLTDFAHVYFDLQAGAITTAGMLVGAFAKPVALIKPAGNGYYACSLTADTDASANLITYVYAAGAGDGSQTQYAGDGAIGIYFAGAALEKGAFPSTLTPTGVAQATRAADFGTVTDLSKIAFNPNAGTAFVKFMLPRLPEGIPGDVGSGIISFDEPTFNNYYGLSVESGGGLRTLAKGVNGANSRYGAGAVTAGVPMKAAFTYGGGLPDSVSMNGGPALANGNSAPTGLSELRIGRFAGNPAYLNGWILGVLYFPRRFADTELQNLTAP